MNEFKVPVIFGDDDNVVLGKGTVEVETGFVVFKVSATGPDARPLLDVLTSEEILSLSINVGTPTKKK